MAQPRKLHDRFFLQAKAEGYVARSAYKLKDIQDRRKIIKKGDWVLDLGCSPGSWLQVASQIVGSQGRILGVDLKESTLPPLPNVRTIVADVFKLDPKTLAKIFDPGAESVQVDVLLSDMAPSTEGGAGGTTDHFRSIELCRRVLELIPSLLRPKGNLVMKVFEGEAYADLLKETARLFDDAKGFKPEASRDVSREMFIIAKGFKGPHAARDKKPPAGVAPAKPAPKPGWGTRA